MDNPILDRTNYCQPGNKFKQIEIHEIQYKMKFWINKILLKKT